MDLELIKSILNIAQSDTSYDDYLTSMYNLCLSYVKDFKGIVIPAEDRTYVYRDISGKKIFQCFEKPVNLIKTATLDGASIELPEYQAGFFYFSQPLTGSKLVITANVGYTTIPAELTTIINLMLEFLFKQATKANYFSMPEQKPLSPKEMRFPAYINDLLESL